MTRDEMIHAVDAEIERLQLLRDQLRAAGRGSAASAGHRRVLSEDGRRRIAEAQHRRWAAEKARGANYLQEQPGVDSPGRQLAPLE